ncbi:hypothetical protein BMT54_01780 [Pasteurellaceae bacterium 15-036681]|nr:hypothetical protein BMT54_01780 [Pasteurellaceae bacterium 15-036681]
MKIDLDEVKQGDAVWHDRYGWGTVKRVNHGTCDVKFNESERVLTFTEGGKQNGHKVLYWQPPMVFTPRKGRDYQRFLRIVAELHGQLFEGA